MGKSQRGNFNRGAGEVYLRYDKKIVLVAESNGGYDPTLGYAPTPQKSELLKYADISGLGVDRQQQLFGDIDKTRQVMRIQGVYKGSVTYIMFDGKKYDIETKRYHRNRTSFYVREMKA